MKERGGRKGFALVGGVLLVGVFVLLWDFEVLPDGFWWEFFLLWPLWLAAAVANLLLSHWRPRAGSAAALAIVAVTLGAAWWQAAGENRTPILPTASETVAVPLDGPVQAMELNLTVSGGVLALGGGAPAGELLVGEFEGMAFPAAQFSGGMRSAGSRRALDFSLLGSWEIAFPPRRPISSGQWNLRLANGVATDLSVVGGATTLDLDLRALNVKSLRVIPGGANIEVTLPATAGRTSVNFAGTATRLHITVPAGVAARIDVEGGGSSGGIDTARFPSQGDGRYASPDFENADNRVTISIGAGAGDISVR
ncbi:MAG: hypothetical protein OXG17_00640 [Chloroflexi bacterium]|nr:hypothetical protein [Chloroflexota bacterium]